ncbi:MAG: SRPBCC domain-containing protein [Promethearchaeota archaeon]
MENIILIKEELDCTTNIAFEMFTKNTFLERWLTEKADVIPRVGGKYELYWEPENRDNNSTIGCKITGIEKGRFLSFNWKGPVQFKSFMNFVDPLTHVIVFFTQIFSNPKKTTINLFHTGWRKNPEWQEARNYFEKAWTNALKKLQEKIKNKTLP